MAETTATADLTITHTHEEGTLLEGDPRPHHGTLKTLGWRWSRNLGAWYWPHSRDKDAYQPRLDATAEDMRAHGFTVSVEVDNTARSAAERVEDGMRRAEDRAAGLDRKAQRLAAESDARYKAYRSVADHIPLGQPVMPDHYSYRSDVNRRAKMHRNAEKSFELARESEDAARRAQVAQRTAQGKNVGQTRRKIDELEAEHRQIARRLGEFVSSQHVDETRRAWRQDLTRRQQQITDEIGYWRSHLAELEASGRKVWGPDDFAKGDRVQATYGGATVVRVNKKSLTIRSDVMPQITNTLRYDKVTGKG